MKKITILNDQPKQNMNLILDNGSVVAFALRYVNNQQGWYYSVSHSQSGFASTNRRLVNNPNNLRQFRKTAKFGLACLVSDGGEPIQLGDFVSGRVSLYILDSADLQPVEDLVNA